MWVLVTSNEFESTSYLKSAAERQALLQASFLRCGSALGRAQPGAHQVSVT